MKQTAVEWLYINLNECYEHYDNGKCSYTHFVNESKKILEQAKEKEKQQHSDTWRDGMKSDNGYFGSFEKYYNETFNSSTK